MTKYCDAKGVSDIHLKQLLNLGLDAGYEQSIRLSATGISRHRWLVSFTAASFKPFLPTIMRTWKSPFPGERFEYELDDISHIHLGKAISSDGNVTLKLYLEYDEGTPGFVDANLRFRAIKWSDLQSAVYNSSYYQRNFSSQEAVAVANSNFLGHQASQDDVLSSAVEKLITALHVNNFPNKPTYLEVVDAESDRHSLDLNLYDLSHTKSPVLEFIDTFSVAIMANSCDVDLIRNTVNKNTPGHLSFGRHRNSELFITYYYGVTDLTDVGGKLL